jgi:hypothetical protein
MVQAADRTWHYPQPHHGRIPQVFSLVARRQAER